MALTNNPRLMTMPRDEREWTAFMRELDITLIAPEDGYHYVQSNGGWTRVPGPDIEALAYFLND